MSMFGKGEMEAGEGRMVATILTSILVSFVVFVFLVEFPLDGSPE